MPAPRRSGLLIVFIVVFIDLLGFGIVLPLLPRYGDYYGADRWTLGTLMAAFSAMQFLFAPLWGRLSDRIGRRPVLLLGLAGSVISYALFGYVSSMPADSVMLGLGPVAWLLISRVGAGVAGATIPTAQAYIADSTGSAERGKGMALIGAAFGMGFTFGPLLAAAFASNDPAAPPSSAPGWLASGLSLLALLAAIGLLPESLTPGSRPAGRHWLDSGALSHAIRRPALLQLLLTMFLTTFAFAGFESTLALLTEALGMSDRDNFYVFAYLGLVLTLSQGLLVRRMLPRIGEERAAWLGSVLMSAGFVLVALTAPAADTSIEDASRQSALVRLFIVLPVSVVGFAALTPSLQSLLSLRSSSDEQGEILGLGQSMSALARIAGPVAGIALIRSDPRWPYWAAAGVMTVGLVLVATLRRENRTDEPAPSPVTSDSNRDRNSAEAETAGNA